MISSGLGCAGTRKTAHLRCTETNYAGVFPKKGDSGLYFGRRLPACCACTAFLKGVIIQLAEKLKIIPLGGLDEIGKNCTVLEYGKDMIVIDCGVGFPEEDMYGVDLVIPDFSYLVANQKKLRGMFITLGHEDHIGSIPYCLRDVSCPIHGTAMTNGLIRLKLEEHKLADKVKLITHKPGDMV